MVDNRSAAGAAELDYGTSWHFRTEVTDVGYSVLETTTELKKLRKGRGIEAPDIEARVGPALRAAVGYDGRAEPALLRQLVAELLNTHIDGIAPDVGLACRAAFALHRDLRQRLLKDRIEVVARRIAVDPRTVQRRIDQGIELIAQQITADDPVAKQPVRAPWRTVDLRAILVLDLPVPEVIEIRRIVADRDGLDQVDLEVTLSPLPGHRLCDPPVGLGLDMLYGGVLTDRVMRSSNRIGFGLRLPRPIDRGMEHEYAFRVTMPQRRPMAPHYVCTPRYPCGHFRLRVRFGPDRVPASIWRLAEVRSNEVDDPAAHRSPLRADPAGEVTALFSGLAPNLSYGLAWEPMP